MQQYDLTIHHLIITLNVNILQNQHLNHLMRQLLNNWHYGYLMFHRIQRYVSIIHQYFH